MKSNLIPGLALALSGGLALFSARADETNSLRVVVIPSRTVVHIQEPFRVGLRVENLTINNQYLHTGSQDWQWDWQVSNPDISLISGPMATANIPITIKIPPGGAYTNEMGIEVQNPDARGEVSFQMGFTARDIKKTYWSDDVKIILLPTVVKDAYLGTQMAKLAARIPELSLVKISDGAPDEQNVITADYTDGNGNMLRITAKAYDTAAAAKAGQEFDQKMIQAGGWNKKQIFQNVQVFENTDYGTMYFQLGPRTFNLTTMEGKPEVVQPLLRKIGSALIADFPPPK